MKTGEGSAWRCRAEKVCKKLGAVPQAPACLVLLDGQCVFRDSGGHSPTGLSPALLAETRGHILPPQLCLHPP